MRKMKEFLIENLANILTVIVFTAALVILFLRGKRGIVSEILFHLVTEAEKIYGSGKGHRIQFHAQGNLIEAETSHSRRETLDEIH